MNAPPFLRLALLAPLLCAAAQAQTLRIDSEPASARVEIDGVHVGQTPTVVAVDAGTRKVRLTRMGYAAWEQEVEAEPDTETALQAVLERPTGTFEIRDLPEGARVTLDGQPVSGPTAARSGGVVVQVEIPGRAPFQAGLPVGVGAETVAVYQPRQFRANVAVLAAAVPGGAQLLNDRETIGAVFLGAALLGGGTALVGQFSHASVESDHRAALFDYELAQTEAEVAATRAAVDDLVERGRGIRRLQLGGLALAGAAYLVSLTDAARHHVWRPGLRTSEPRYPTFSVAGAGGRLTLPL